MAFLKKICYTLTNAIKNFFKKPCIFYIINIPVILLFNTANSESIITDTIYGKGLISEYLKSNSVEINSLRKTNIIRIIEKLKKIPKNRLKEIIEGEVTKSIYFFSVYPIHSKSLTPGKILNNKKQSLQKNLASPVFIVGDDILSIKWMTYYEKQLEKLNAKGFVVNVDSKYRMSELHKKFSNLTLIPIPGEQVFKWLNLEHYPILISNKLIEQ